MALCGFPSWSRGFDSPRSLYSLLKCKELWSDRKGVIETPSDCEKSSQPAFRRKGAPMAMDLVLRTDFQRAFPGLAEGLREAQRVFDSVRSFEDVESTFLKGAGLSANTYRAYLSFVAAVIAAKD